MDFSGFNRRPCAAFVCVCVRLVGTAARLLLLPGSLLPWSLALHAAGLLGCELRPLSGGEVSGARTKLTPQRREQKSVFKNAKAWFERCSEGEEVSPRSPRLMRHYSQGGALHAGGGSLASH